MKIQFKGYDKDAIYGYFKNGQVYNLPDNVACKYINCGSAVLAKEGKTVHIDFIKDKQKFIDNKEKEIENKINHQISLTQINAKTPEDKERRIEEIKESFTEIKESLDELKNESTDKPKEIKENISTPKKRGRPFSKKG